jgi:hypothetical protein
MNILTFDVLASFTFAVLYGFMENRLFRILTFWKFEKESREDGLIDHFKLYHVFMLFLFIIAGRSSSLKTWIFNIFMMPMVEDAAWFLFEGRMPKPDDWTNWPIYKLILGLPYWYWIVGAILALITICF